MTPQQIGEAAIFLAQARLSGPPTPSLPDNLTAPGTIAEGYAVQSALHAVLESAGFGPRVGHKIGCTTPVMQAYLGIDHPCAGEVFETTVFDRAVELPLSRYQRVGVECEIAARLGRDLPVRSGGHTRESVSEAVDSLMAGIERVDDRYPDYSALPPPVLISSP